MSDDYTRLIADAPEHLRALGLTLSPLGERVASIMAMVCGGIHNFRKPERVKWADPFCVEVVIPRVVATDDPDGLILLLAASAAMGLRVELDGRGGRLIAQFHYMRTRTGEALDCDAALERVKERFTRYAAMGKAVQQVKVGV
jgi:hypothetical protein